MGYFLWKSFIINDAINKLNDGDLIFYSDVGDMFHPELISFVEETIEDDPCLFMVGNSINKDWTRRDCFVYMDCDEEEKTDEESRRPGGKRFQIYRKEKKRAILNFI